MIIIYHSDLLREISYGMHNRNLILISRSLILISYLFGKGNLYKKLNESLTVDNSKSAKLLGWHPPVSTKLALKSFSRIYRKFKLRNG